MKPVAGLVVAALFAGAGANAAGPPRCTLKSGLYEERLALASQPEAEPPASPGGNAGNGSRPGKLNAVFAQYYAFLGALGAASRDTDPAAVANCCGEAGQDPLASLACQLVSYLAGGRKDSVGFMTNFPAAKKEVAILADLDAVSAAAFEQGTDVPSSFLPKGPGNRLIDELFLLVLDGRDEAIIKFFALAASAGGGSGRYVDDKLALLFRESPGVLVTNWFVLRKYRQKLKTVAQSLTENAPPDERQRLVRGIQAFCGKDDSDCEEILKLVSARR